MTNHFDNTGNTNNVNNTDNTNHINNTNYVLQTLSSLLFYLLQALED